MVFRLPAALLGSLRRRCAAAAKRHLSPPFPAAAGRALQLAVAALSMGFSLYHSPFHQGKFFLFQVFHNCGDH